MTTTHIKNFLDDNESFELFEYLLQNTKWQVWSFSPNSRPVARYIPDNIPYVLEKVMLQIEQNFNIILERQAFLNIYRDGNDYCPYHADQYSVDTITLSLGETRDFLIKPNQSGTRAQKFTLESGDLYIMSKELHNDHKHSVPKRKNITEPRISILMFIA